MQAGHTPCVAVRDEEHVQIGDKTVLQFDQVFGEDSQQQQVYDVCAKSLVDGLFEGFNGSILAYGQTGSGKTYTMGSDWFDEMNLLEMDKSFEGESTILRGLQDDDDAEHLSKGELQTLIRKIRGIRASKCGVLPRAFLQVAETIEQYVHCSEDDSYPRDVLDHIKIEASFFEIYQEKVYDLLHPEVSTKQISVLEGRHGDVHIRGTSPDVLLTWKRPKPEEESDSNTPLKYIVAYKLLKCLSKGVANRTTSSTSMNDTSSRSHAVFTLSLSGILRNARSSDDVEKATGSGKSKRLTSQLRLVDLAGSERAKRTQATGMRFAESVQINHGLLALGNVIAALAESPDKTNTSPRVANSQNKKPRNSSRSRSRTTPPSDNSNGAANGEPGPHSNDSEDSRAKGTKRRSRTPLSLIRNTGKGAGAHIPYRDSKLTRLLRDSLGGNSRTCFIACISPCQVDFHESRSTLRYAERARSIKNTPSIGIEPIDMEIHAAKKVKQFQKNGGGNEDVAALHAATTGGGMLRILAPQLSFAPYNIRAFATYLVWKVQEIRGTLGSLLSDKDISSMNNFCCLVQSWLRKSVSGLHSKEKCRRRISSPDVIADLGATSCELKSYSDLQKSMEYCIQSMYTENYNAKEMREKLQGRQGTPSSDTKALENQLEQVTRENELLRAALSAAEGNYVRALKSISEEDELSTSNASSHAANASTETSSVIDDDLQRSIEAAFATEVKYPGNTSIVKNESKYGQLKHEYEKLRLENYNVEQHLLKLEKIREDEIEEQQRREDDLNDTIASLQKDIMKKDQMIEDISRERHRTISLLQRWEKNVEDRHTDSKILSEDTDDEGKDSESKEHRRRKQAVQLKQEESKESSFVPEDDCDLQERTQLVQVENNKLKQQNADLRLKIEDLEKQLSACQASTVDSRAIGEPHNFEPAHELPSSSRDLLDQIRTAEQKEGCNGKERTSKSQQAKDIWEPILRRVKEYVRQPHSSDQCAQVQSKLQSVRAQIQSTENELSYYCKNNAKPHSEPEEEDIVLQLQDEIDSLKKEESALESQVTEFEGSKEHSDPGDDRRFIREVFSILGSIPSNVLRAILFQSVVDLARTLTYARRYRRETKEAKKQVENLSVQLSEKDKELQKMEHRDKRWKNKISRLQAQLDTIENSATEESHLSGSFRSGRRSQKDSLVLNALDLSDEH